MTDEKDINELTDSNLAAAMGMDEGDMDLAPFQDEEPSSEPTDTLDETVDGSEGSEPSEGETVEEEQSEEATTSEESGDAELPYGERNEIKAALSKDGLPEDLIESLGPDQLRAYWAKRQERDAAFSGMKDDLRRFKSKTPAGEDEAQGDGAPTTEPDTTAPGVDLSALAEEFGDEEAKAIAGYMDSAMGPLRQTNEQLLNALDQMIDSAQRTRLSGVVPGDLGDGWYDKVRARAVELGNAGTYSEKGGQERQDALFDAALRLEFPDAPSPSEMKRENRRAASRRNGAPSRSGRVSRKASTMSKEEKMDRRVALAMEGKSVAEINRALSD